MPLMRGFGTYGTAGFMNELERRRKLAEQEAERQRFQEDMMKVFGIPLNTPQAGQMLNSQNWYNLQNQQLQDEQQARNERMRAAQEQEMYNRQRQAQQDTFDREKFDYGKQQDVENRNYRRQQDAVDAQQRKEYFDYTHPKQDSTAAKPYTDAQVNYVKQKIQQSSTGQTSIIEVLSQPGINSVLKMIEQVDPQLDSQMKQLINTALIMESERVKTTQPNIQQPPIRQNPAQQPIFKQPPRMY